MKHSVSQLISIHTFYKNRILQNRTFKMGNFNSHPCIVLLDKFGIKICKMSTYYISSFKIMNTTILSFHRIGSLFTCSVAAWDRQSFCAQTQHPFHPKKPSRCEHYQRPPRGVRFTNSRTNFSISTISQMILSLYFHEFTNYIIIIFS